MKQIAFAILGCVLLVSVSSAQMPGGPPPDPCAALGKFFTSNVAFTASAKVVVAAKKARDNQTMVMLFAVSGGNMRNEMDMTKMSGVRASDLDGMKQMGMDKMVILKLADRGVCGLGPAWDVSLEVRLERLEGGLDGRGRQDTPRGRSRRAAAIIQKRRSQEEDRILHPSTQSEPSAAKHRARPTSSKRAEIGHSRTRSAATPATHSGE